MSRKSHKNNRQNNHPKGNGQANRNNGADRKTPAPVSEIQTRITDIVETEPEVKKPRIIAEEEPLSETPARIENDPAVDDEQKTSAVDNADDRLKTANMQIENLQKDNQILLDSIKEKNTELTETKAELAKKESSFEELRMSLLDKEKELDKSLREAYALKETLSALQKELDDLKTELGCTESADSGQQKGFFGIFKLSDQVGSLKNSLKESNEYCIELRSENAALRERNSEYMTRFELQKESNKRLASSNESLTKENIRLLSENKNISSELEKEQRRIYDFEEENNYYTNQLKKYQITEPKLKSVIETLMNQFGFMYNAVLNSESYEELKKINEFSTMNTFNQCKSAGFVIHMHERGSDFDTEFPVNVYFVDTDDEALHGKVKECTEFGYTFSEDRNSQFFKKESADIYRYKEPETEPAKEAAEAPAEAPAEVSEEAAEEEVITETPAEAKEEVPAEEPSDVPEKAAEEGSPEEIAAEKTADITEEAPAEKPAVIPEEVTEEEPAEIENRSPAEKPVDAAAEAGAAADYTPAAETVRSDDTEENPKEDASETEDVPEVSLEEFVLKKIRPAPGNYGNRLMWFTVGFDYDYSRSVPHLMNAVKGRIENNEPVRYIYIPYVLSDEDCSKIKKYENSEIRFIFKNTGQVGFKNTMTVEEFIKEFRLS